MTCPSCRGLLGGAAVAGEDTGDLLRIGEGMNDVLLATNAEAELIHISKLFNELEHGRDAYYTSELTLDDENARDDAVECISAALVPLVDKMCALQVATIEGLRSRLQSAFIEDLELVPLTMIEDSCTNRRLLGALLRDLATFLNVELPQRN